MTNSKQWIRLTLVIVGIVLIMALGYWFIYWIKFVHPLDIFRAQEIESIQYFDALNMTVLNELPAPTEEMKFISQGTGGILSPTNVHGRILVVRYAVLDNIDASMNNILNLYKSELTKQGWNEGEKVSIDGYYSLTYSHDTSCVKLVALYGTSEFNLEIWHDFLSQKFSPSLPPSELLYHWDMGETDIVTCP